MPDQEFAERVLRATARSATEAATVVVDAQSRCAAVLGAATARLDSALELLKSAEDPSRGYAAVIEAAPAFEALGPAQAAYEQAMRSYKSAMQVVFLSGAAVMQTVRAVGTVISEPGITAADLRALAVDLRTAVHVTEQQRAAVAATQSPGLAIAAYRWTLAGSLAGMLGALIALLALVQDRIEADRPDPPPSVTVVVPQPDAGEIARQVDERLRERVQQHQAGHRVHDPDGHGQERRGTDR